MEREAINAPCECFRGNAPSQQQQRRFGLIFRSARWSYAPAVVRLVEFPAGWNESPDHFKSRSVSLINQWRCAALSGPLFSRLEWSADAANEEDRPADCYKNL